MLEKKPIRKNYYKNIAFKRAKRIKQRLLFCFKTLALIGLVMGMSLVFILGYDFLTQCSYFRAESITVSGLQRLSTKGVLEQAKIKRGANILALNLPLTRKRLLAHPWINDAEVSRKLPDRIHIKITEHQPIAILDLGRKVMSNADGTIFIEWSKADADDLPVISGLEFSDLHDSENTPANPLQAVMAVLRLGQKKGAILPNRLINRIHVDREIGLTVYAFDKPKAIKLGYNRYPDKLNSLKNILFHLRARHEFVDFESIDLNNLNRIVVNPVRIKSPQEDQKEV